MVMESSEQDGLENTKWDDLEKRMINEGIGQQHSRGAINP
jgi:hypothetical protein